MRYFNVDSRSVSHARDDCPRLTRSYTRTQLVTSLSSVPRRCRVCFARPDVQALENAEMVDVLNHAERTLAGECAEDDEVVSAWDRVAAIARQAVLISCHLAHTGTAVDSDLLSRAGHLLAELEAARVRLAGEAGPHQEFEGPPSVYVLDNWSPWNSGWREHHLFALATATAIDPVRQAALVLLPTSQTEAHFRRYWVPAVDDDNADVLRLALASADLPKRWGGYTRYGAHDALVRALDMARLVHAAPASSRASTAPATFEPSAA